MSGHLKRCYDIEFMMRLKEDALSKKKPDIPLLESCNVIKITSFEHHDASVRISREPRIDRRKPLIGKGSMKLIPSPVTTVHPQCISISLTREEVKLSKSKDAWKPARLKKVDLNEEEVKTQDLYKKFRGILNKLTPQKFDTLLDKVKSLEITTQTRLEGVIDLVFEKAIEEPNFSEAYAVLCSKLSTLKVPCDNDPDKCVNFRGLILSRCQNQFMTKKTDEQVLKLEKELEDCDDPAKKKELLEQLSEEQRRVRKRSVGNVRFIGELYKLKMLTGKIIIYCMTYLVDKMEEEKLECLCKLLTTIGQQVEKESKDQLDVIFKRLHAIAFRKTSDISSRVRFMIHDVIDLRLGSWVTKNVIDSRPKMMNQILKEAEQQQRNIELMNASPSRGKRSGDVRRQGRQDLMMDNQRKAPRVTYTVDTSKFKAVNTQKNLSDIKLAPPSAWNHGSRTMSSTKDPVRASSGPMVSLSRNMFSALDTIQNPPALSIRQKSTDYQQSKSIERCTFTSQRDFNTNNSRGVSSTSSTSTSRSNSGRGNNNITFKRSEETLPRVPQQPSALPLKPSAVPQVISASSQNPSAMPQEPLGEPQEALPEGMKREVKMLVMETLDNPNDEEFASVFKDTLPSLYHSAAVTEILNIALEKSTKDVQTIAKATNRLLSSGTVSGEHFLTGMTEIVECAPDLQIDIPMLYEYLGKFIAPLIEGKHITFVQIFGICKNIIKSNHGHLFLRPLMRYLKDSAGPSFVKMKWSESGLDLKQWMKEEQVPKWLEDNKCEFLVDDKSIAATEKLLSPMETQRHLLQLMNAEENCEYILGWVRDNVGVSSTEDWFMRCLIQAICEHALSAGACFNVMRMSKYSRLISDFGNSKEERETNCLLGVQQLMRQLQYPPGLTLEIFQFLYEQYIISVEGFIAWEVSELEPEGKGVMLKALTSFFTNIKEANVDSSGEE
ncbi:eukaryotic translation initiation factor 4 gamma 3 [Bicyclus anynana]|uniref:Eukaryotic translation initiation factor 4 gamma 3 n=1 Tax=Bicyclus anynana TaxID=110368 RepID=A0A6J1NSN2_BICAN|nr:eukaryotic translation initiation factor 4 gamma 3 [Bicyclus anynana]